MKRIKIDNINNKVLVAAGCSHTAGCAFYKNPKFRVNSQGVYEDVIEWASEELADLYKVPCSLKLVDEKLSWHGKLKDLLNFDTNINLGFGGAGYEACSTALKHYIFKKSTLDNHLIILQLPSPSRVMIPDTQNEKYNINLTSDYINDPDRSYAENSLLQNFFEPGFYEVKFLQDILYLQDYIETKGGNFRIITDFLYPSFLTGKFLNKHKVEFETFFRRGSYKPFYNFDINFILDKLNTIAIPATESYKTLASQGLVFDDNHLSEDGNAQLANLIYKNLENYSKFKLSTTVI